MNRLNSYASPLDLYRQVGARQTGAAQPQPFAQPQHVAAQEAALSSAEQRHIQQQFPDAPGLSMRLYGPQASAHTVTPGALGGRLDLQG